MPRTRFACARLGGGLVLSEARALEQQLESGTRTINEQKSPGRPAAGLSSSKIRFELPCEQRLEELGALSIPVIFGNARNELSGRRAPRSSPRDPAQRGGREEAEVPRADC